MNRRLASIPGLVFFFSVAAGAAIAQPPTPGNDSGPCTAAARATLRSCGFGVQDDYWLAVARCRNVPEADERAACLAAASEERAQGRKLCAGQREAREDVCDRLGEDRYAPVVDPASFVADVTNPYSPLKPGSHWVYEGRVAEGFEHVDVVVTAQTREILGVTCVVVRDTVLLDGKLSEDTLDFFAQDLSGNVWYFGEESKSYENGALVSLEGSWEAGRDDAKPGLIMEAHPRAGDFYRQEFAIGVAEDLAEVKALNLTVQVPAGTFSHVLKTAETTPMEPDALEHKFYAPGVGVIRTVDVDTGGGTKLVAYTIP